MIVIRRVLLYRLAVKRCPIADARGLPVEWTFVPIRPKEIEHSAEYIYFKSVVVSDSFFGFGLDERLGAVIERHRTMPLDDFPGDVLVMASKLSIEVLVSPTAFWQWSAFRAQPSTS